MERIISQRGEMRTHVWAMARLLSLHFPASPHVFSPLIFQKWIDLPTLLPILPSKAENSSLQRTPHTTLSTHNHVPSLSFPSFTTSNAIMTENEIPPTYTFPFHHLFFSILFSSPLCEIIRQGESLRLLWSLSFTYSFTFMLYLEMKIPMMSSPTTILLSKK